MKQPLYLVIGGGATNRFAIRKNKHFVTIFGCKKLRDFLNYGHFIQYSLPREYVTLIRTRVWIDVDHKNVRVGLYTLNNCPE
tara:strand:+ start:339 stop:584 length:246 start_codon:yes stop_codon:yes gene_type:complete